MQTTIAQRVGYDEGLRLRFTSLSEHALVGTQYRDYLLREYIREGGGRSMKRPAMHGTKAP